MEMMIIIKQTENCNTISFSYLHSRVIVCCYKTNSSTAVPLFILIVVKPREMPCSALTGSHPSFNSLWALTQKRVERSLLLFVIFLAEDSDSGCYFACANLN